MTNPDMIEATYLWLEQETDKTFDRLNQKCSERECVELVNRLDEIKARAAQLARERMAQI